MQPTGAGYPATELAAEAEVSTEVGRAAATTSRTAAVTRPPEATGSQGEAARTGVEGGAGPSEPRLRSKNFQHRMINYLICFFRIE